MTVLSAMIHSPPFVAAGRKRVAWEDVARLSQERNPDLRTVTGVLCEKRYKLVRDEYMRVQAAHRASSGQDEPHGSEQDDALEELIGLQEAFNAEEDASQEKDIRLQVDEDRFYALEEGKRDTACARALQDRDNASVVNRAAIE